ncbi:MAG: SusD/RagB family nutrient-binding outer membrane lipoprotein [Ginsengibacter sp.]
MKLLYKIKTSFAITMLFCILNACTKNFDELNTDPAIVTETLVNPDNLFSRVQKESIFSIPDFSRVSEFAGFMANEASGFPFKNQDYDFSVWYRTYLINLNETIRLTQNTPELSNKNAMARIFRVWLYQILTDRYGDIPYTEAASALENFIATPKYDKQEFIYKDLFTQLKAATAQLSDDPSKRSYGAADILFGGNVDRWRKFGNSLRLRMAIRVRFVDNALAQQNISDVISAPLIIANAENAKLLSEGSGASNMNNRNPILNFITNGNQEPRHFSFTVLELMAKNNTNDPRIPIYFKLPLYINPGSSIPYKARPINIDGPEKTPYGRDSISFVGNFFEASQFTFNLITAAQVNFLKAEAALAGLIPDDANNLYRAGIQLTMQQYGVSAGDITTFLAGSTATLSGTVEGKLEQIINQKYLSLIYQSDEAWAEYRRTGYPKMWLGSAPTDTQGKIPRRLTYPLDEYAKNDVNVAAAAAILPGGDKLTTRLWWDVKAGLPYAHPRQGMFPPESW